MKIMAEENKINALESVDNNENIDYNVADIYFNLACIYSIINNRPKAIKNLSLAIEIDSGYRQKATSETGFASMRDVFEFKKIVNDDPALI